MITSGRSGNRFEGGDLVVASLKALGVRQIFSVSGGPLNSIYSACAAQALPLHHARHEAGACFMAEAISRITAIPGVVAVTLGPGVTNTVTPALVARMAGTPLLIIGAQANTGAFDRGAGMSADHIPIMAPVTKFAARVLQTERIPEYIEIAFRKMWAGTPGPVFLEIPVNVLAAPAVEGHLPSFAHAWPGLSQRDRDVLRAAIAGARRPLLLIGDDVRWDPPQHLKKIVEQLHVPFASLRLARGAIEETHPQCIGPGYIPCNKTLRRGLQEADLVILLGHHFEFDLEFGRSVGQATRVMQCVVDPANLGRNRKADFGAVASPGAFVDMVADIRAEGLDRVWVDGLAQAWRTERAGQCAASNEGDPLHPVAAIDAVLAALPDDATLVCSHGNVDFWVDARVQLKHPNRYLRAGQSGALGAEVPYGIGARFAHPDRPVVVFVGDGGIGYHAIELETAVRYNRPVIIVVLDDRKWGAIALPQRMAYGGEFEMDLPMRDWPKVAQGLGGGGAHARTKQEIAAAIRDALASSFPAIVQIPVRSVLSPYMAHISQ
ncbi:MAG: thiamine pyrophosphate-binding protein [Proteobacteria bacterium]|nr:thiamine pyrophosphate-binding protein [Pseudomonadota bacterium]